MTLKRHVTVLVMAAGLLSQGLPLVAQTGEKFTARLAWVPTSGADRGNVAGRGSATATLSGRTLSIAGSFDGLAAPATVARLHWGVAKGARGEAFADLTITRATGGMLSGSVALTAEQVDALRAGRLYIQVHSEKGVPPDGGTLWGWLLR